jgi:hypothetical protein
MGWREHRVTPRANPTSRYDVDQSPKGRFVMKQRLLSATLLAALASGALSAGRSEAAPGLNLGWTLACPTVANIHDQIFACDDNGAFFTIIGSAKAPVGLTKVTAEEIVVDLQEANSALQPWWHLEDEQAGPPPVAAGCRGTSSAGNVGSIALSATFTGASTTVCKNYWGTSASGGQNYIPGQHDQFASDPSGARLQGVFARTASGAGALIADTQYYVFNLSLDSQHTIADPTDPTYVVCPGCADGVCIVFNSVKFDEPPGTAGGDILVGTQDVQQNVTWQGGGAVNCQVIPVRRATWGKVKSLYR